ncbi:MAG: beta-N-acetylhexosaminidase [Candidatus Thorarchaeota archaeon]
MKDLSECFIKESLIIPEPVYLIFSDREFTLTENTIIQSNQKLLNISDHLKNFLFPPTGFNLSIKKVENITTNDNTINLILINKNNQLGSDGYRLKITPHRINISARKPAGVFYGIQTLRQLLPLEIESKIGVENIKWKLPCLKIEDYPRFPWRGYMLDEARHFHGKEIVKKLLDLMALFKLNIFHWHLTDDQGWRIEIKKYPKLIEIGSKRNESQIGDFSNNKKNGIPHSGYYLQEEIKEIITYAKNRFITIIPEIDMPGHTRAAIASYPNLSCRGFSLRVSPHWGIHRDIICIGKEEVFEFIKGVLDEIAELFSSDIIHIGGDEVPKNRWKECERCQSRIEKEGLKNEEDLQVYFTNRITAFINSKGKRTMGWNEILDENLKEDIICQYWLRGKEKVFRHLQNNGKVINSDFKFTYLDHSYSFTPLKLAYGFEPIPKKLKNQYHENVLGLEALMWGEFIPNLKRLEWQTFPRLIAFSEIGWTPKDKKDFRSFQIRLDNLLKRLDFMGINYANKNEVKGVFLEEN